MVLGCCLPDPTVITGFPEDIELEWYKDIFFSCESYADDTTPTSVVWYLNGNRLYDEEDKIVIDRNHNLRIITRNDNDGGKSYEGEFMCIATNGYSRANASAFLAIPQEAIGKFTLDVAGKITSPFPCALRHGNLMWLVHVC